MALSNAQGLLFAEISTDDIRLEGPPVTTLKGWFGAQQVGQIKSLITNTVNEHKGVVTHTVGDSILSSFADAQAALSAALGIQRTVAKAQNPATGMIVNGFIEPIVKTLPMEYAVELSRLIEMNMEGSVG